MYVMTPFILYRLAIRGIKSRDYLARWKERFGYFQAPEQGCSLWVHAVSVGEVNAAAPLVDALRKQYPNERLIVTTVTPTGSDRVHQLWGNDVFHVYLPYDLPSAMRRFMQRVKPRMAIIMETEIWPNLFFACVRNHIPLVVANARLSRKSLRGYGPIRYLMRMAIRSATHVLAQSPQDANRFIELGARPTRVHIVGNLKYEMLVPKLLKQDATALRAQFAPERPVWMAASTHDGEEMAIIEAHAQLMKRFPDAVLLVAPRHPERFEAMAELCRSYGFVTHIRSEDDLPNQETQCFVVNTMGELLMFFSVSDIAFVAGSFEPIGGHNVLEPAALGVPVLVGPHTFNFEEVTDLLLEEHAAVRVADADALAKQLIAWFEQPDERRLVGKNARRVVLAERGAVQRTMDYLNPILSRMLVHDEPDKPPNDS